MRTYLKMTIIQKNDSMYRCFFLWVYIHIIWLRYKFLKSPNSWEITYVIFNRNKWFLYAVTCFFFNKPIFIPGRLLPFILKKCNVSTCLFYGTFWLFQQLHSIFFELQYRINPSYNSSSNILELSLKPSPRLKVRIMTNWTILMIKHFQRLY